MPNQYFYEKQLPPNEPIEFQVERMDAGIVSDISNRDAPVESASDASTVRFETGGVRKDFGRSELGDGATGRILALVEHRYFQNNAIRHRLVRLVYDEGSLSLQVLTGGAWVESATYDEIENAYLSTVSIQNLLAIADGKRILKWVEEFETETEAEDFTDGLALDDVDEESNAVVVDPALAVSDSYTINFSILWGEVPSSQESSVQIVFRHNGVEFLRRSFSHTPGDDPDTTFLQEISTDIFRLLAPGDTLQIAIGDGTEMMEEDYIDIDLELDITALEVLGATFSLDSNNEIQLEWTAHATAETQYTFTTDSNEPGFAGGGWLGVGIDTVDTDKILVIPPDVGGTETWFWLRHRIGTAIGPWKLAAQEFVF